MLTRSSAIAAFAIALGCAHSHAQTAPRAEPMTLGGRKVVVWKPPAVPGISSPVVIFSHGYLGCATQSTFLTEALASHGYLVIAPQHNDATCRAAQRRDRPPSQRPPSFMKPEAWTDDTFVDRADDIRAVVEAIARDPQLGARADLDRLALVGHSLGGYTVVGLAGGWPSWKMPNVKAVLALSPYSEPFVKHNTLSQLSAPVMYQGGTLDWGITPFLTRAHGAYDASATPKYLVNFAGAGHFAWTDFPSTLHGRIVEYSLAFLDHYLRGADASGLLSKAGKSVAELRHDSDVAGRLLFPIVFAAACEGEDCETSFRALACGDAVLRATANANAAIVARVARGDTVVVKQTDLHVLRPGIVVLKRAYVLATDPADDGGPPRPRADTLRFAAGDTLFLLRYLALGEWQWWRGRLSEGSEFWAGPEDGRLGGAMHGADSSRAVGRSQPVIHSWWLIERRAGEVGWWLQDSLSSIRSIPMMAHWNEHC